MELNKIAKITMGQSPVSSSYNKDGDGLPFFQGNADFGIKYPVTRIWCSSPKKIAHKGDILISVRAPIGAINIANCDCCIGRGLASIKVNEKKYNNDYVYTYLKASSKKLNQFGTGSTFKAINKSVLCNFDVPNLSYNEQSEFMMKVDCLSQILDSRREQLEKLDLLIKARFVEMFGGVGECVKISEICNVVSGGTPSRSNSEFWDNGHIPWVKTTELQNNFIHNTQEKITDKGLENSSAKILPRNTILIAMYGQGKTRGMTGLLNIKACTNQACAAIMPSKNINYKYLWIFLINSYDNLRNLAKGGNQPNLNISHIKNFLVPLPPLGLQNQFADFVTQVEKIKADVQKSLDKTQILFDSLMQQYFG